jgi:ankyrin repeat protein
MKEAMDQMMIEIFTQVMNIYVPADKPMLVIALIPHSYLLKVTELAIAFATGSSQLHVLSWVGDANGVQKLLKSRQGDVKGTNSRGHTPLHLAAAAGRYQVIKLLLDAAPAAAVDAPTDQDGDTPLLLAVGRGDGPYHDVGRDHAEAVRELLRHKADPTASNAAGVTPLHLACIGGSIDVMEALMPARVGPELLDALTRCGEEQRVRLRRHCDKRRCRPMIF